MLPEEAFIRHIPLSIELEDRLRLDALASAVDSVLLAYDSLVSAMGASPFSGDISWRERLGWATLAWSMVDNAHVVRELWRHYDRNPGSAVELFINGYESATFMRNDRDHVQKGLRNLARRTGRPFPMLGVLSFSVPRSRTEDDHPGVIDKYRRVHLPLGALTHHNHSLGMASSDDRQVAFPVGDIVLSAFDHSINLTALSIDIERTTLLFDRSIGEFLKSKIRAAAAASGSDAGATIRETGSGTFTIRMDFERRRE